MRALQTVLLFYLVNLAFVLDIDFDQCFSTLTGNFSGLANTVAEFTAGEASAVTDLVEDVQKICQGCNFDCGFLNNLTTKDDKSISCIGDLVDVLTSATEAVSEEGINLLADYDLIKDLIEAIDNCVAIFKSSSSELCSAYACATCDSNGTCTSCVPGFSLGNHTCWECPLKGCDTCGVLELLCDSCLPGYTLYEGECYECPSNCSSSCSPRLIATGGFIQTECSDNNSDDQDPDLCSAYACTACDSNGTCTSCVPGFSLENHTCWECLLKGCDTCGVLGLSCDSCLPGYTFYEGECYECPSNCSSSCFPRLIATGFIQAECSDNDSDDQDPDLCSAYACTACDSNGTCTSCVPGFSLGNHTCWECPIKGCDTCGVLGLSCDSCLPGYTLYEGECYECPSNCSSCSASLQANGLLEFGCADSDTDSDSDNDSDSDDDDDDSDAFISDLTDLTDA